MITIINCIAYLGFYRETCKDIYNVTENDIDLGFKKVDCFECNGTGIWDFIEYIPAEPCVCCKGTGKIYINV